MSDVRINPPLRPTAGGMSLLALAIAVILVMVIVLAGGTSDVTTRSDTTGAGDSPGADPANNGDTASTDNWPVGTAQVSWVLDEASYVAVLEVEGPTGIAHVSYFDPDTGVEATVRQSLTLEETGGTYHYTGHDPIDPTTGEVASNYSPDIFWLERAGDVWDFTQVCSLDVCAPVNMP